MLQSRALSLTLLMTTALTIGACSDKDKAQVERPLDSAKASVLSKPGTVDFKALMAVSQRKTNEATSEAVLKDLGLWEKTDQMTWKSRSGSNGTYQYSDFSQTSVNPETNETVTLTIKTLTLIGLHEVDGEPSFDRIDMDTVKAVHTDGEVKIKTATLSRPSPAFASEILLSIQNLSNLDNLNDIDPIDDNDDMSVGAVSFQDLDITSPDVIMSLSSLNYGKDETSGKKSFEINTVRVKGRTDDTVTYKGQNDIALPVTLSIDKAFIHGLTSSQNLGDTNVSVSNLTAGINQTFDQFLIDNFDLEYDGLSISSQSLQGQSVKKGDVTTVTQVMEPLTIKMVSDPQSDQVTSVKDFISKLGYDALTFDMQQTSEINLKTDQSRIYDSYVKMNDGFVFNYAYDVSGMNAMHSMTTSGEDGATEDALKALKVNSGTLSLTDNSILDRVFKMIAEQQGTSESVLKMQAKSVLMLASLGATSKEDGKVITNLAGAIGDFIDAGGTLDISLKPETALSLESIQGLQRGQTPLSQLGLTASVRKAQ